MTAKSGEGGQPKDPQPPVLPPDLEPASPDRIDDGDEWSGLRISTGDFTGQESVNATWERSQVTGVRLAAAVVRELRATDVEVRDCDLSGADLTGGSFVRVAIANSRMLGTVLAEIRLQDVVLSDCTMDGTNLRFSKAERVTFTDCSMTDVDFTGAALAGARFERCELRQARFDKAQLAGARFVRCRMEEIVGATGLRGTTIDADSMLPVATALVAELGIAVE